MNIEGDNLIAWAEELERQNERLRAALELARDAVEWNDPERNGVLIRIKMALANEEDAWSVKRRTLFNDFGGAGPTGGLPR